MVARAKVLGQSGYGSVESALKNTDKEKERRYRGSTSDIIHLSLRRSSRALRSARLHAVAAVKVVRTVRTFNGPPVTLAPPRPRSLSRPHHQLPLPIHLFVLPCPYNAPAPSTSRGPCAAFPPADGGNQMKCHVPSQSCSHLNQRDRVPANQTPAEVSQNGVPPTRNRGKWIADTRTNAGFRSMQQ
jgi:hypothetical protein